MKNNIVIKCCTPGVSLAEINPVIVIKLLEGFSSSESGSLATCLPLTLLSCLRSFFFQNHPPQLRHFFPKIT